ncbi:hypothetical protein GUJ93_ZPchr0016g2556 [Zizania palustris]|uniref:Uncharacterized protein n=1 Tax=Zizania palustris TaxID=103762 RepID=A0A8J5SYW7_ZIZPA|nr:hypothetical protein GUJ93_ZPchr0016g2556 [Zizania palustris]
MICWEIKSLLTLWPMDEVAASHTSTHHSIHSSLSSCTCTHSSRSHGAMEDQLKKFAKLAWPNSKQIPEEARRCEEFGAPEDGTSDWLMQRCW